jgi:hypothetical protein
MFKECKDCKVRTKDCPEGNEVKSKYKPYTIEVSCFGVCPAKLFCTRPHGHRGSHEAQGHNRECFARWNGGKEDGSVL